MFNVKETQIPDVRETVNINFRSLKMQDVLKLCKLINKLFAEGYKIDEEPTPRTCPKISQILNLKLIKEYVDYEALAVQEGIKGMSLDDLTTRRELTCFAEIHNLKIPEDMTHRLTIKKYLKDIFTEEPLSDIEDINPGMSIDE